jgi:hypothetical protein
MAKTVIVGGAGTRAGASDSNGGAYTGSVTWAQAQGANGAPIATATAAAISDNGSGFIRIISSGSFVSALVNVYAYCDFSGTYTDGRYLVTAVDVSGNYIDINLAYSSNTPTVNVNIGGALLSINVGMLFLADADTLKISGGPYTTANGNNIIMQCQVAVTATTNPIAYQNRIKIEGVNSSGVIDYDNPIVLDGETTKITFRWLSYYTAKNIRATRSLTDGFDATGGPDFTLAYRCISDYNTGMGFEGDDNCWAIGCRTHHNGTYGIQFDNDGIVIACESHNNGNVGIDTDGAAVILYNRSYNNTNYEIQMNYGKMINNIAWNDSAITALYYFDEQGAYVSDFIGNIADGKNLSPGLTMFDIVAPAEPPIIMNNSFYNCTTGAKSGNDLYDNEIMMNNNFYGCANNVGTNGYVSGVGDDAVLADPKFNDPANGDYTLKSDSPLIGAGFDWGVTAVDDIINISIGYYNRGASISSGGGISRSRQLMG